MEEKDNNTKMGVTWRFLDRLLDSYELMLKSQSQYLNSINKSFTEYDIQSGTPIKDRVCFERLKIATYNFYIKVQAKFDDYLKQEDIAHDFSTILDEDQPKIILSMIRILSKWATKDGPFATLVDTYNVGDAWKKG